MEDLNKQNQRILEQQKEELQLSLLTRLQLEAEKFNETVTTQQHVDIDKAKPLRKKLATHCPLGPIPLWS